MAQRNARLVKRSKVVKPDGWIKPEVPKTQPLPGLVRKPDARLRVLCEEIANDLSIVNAASARIKHNRLAALPILVAKGGHSVVHSGVELTRKVGAEKLTVKLVDSDESKITMDSVGDTGTEDDPDDVDEAGADEAGADEPSDVG